MADVVLSIRDLHKIYAGGVHAVRGVSFDVHQGESVAIIGSSGSGKSTVLRCINRLIEPTDGIIELRGEQINTPVADVNEVRSRIGMVFQSFGLLPHRTILDNVAFPLEMRGQDKHDRRERALEVIKLVGLEGREEYFPRELSGGQQQRVGIARSLAIEPDIWFLDEPFSALDPLIRREMQDEFLRLQDILGKTIAFITHDFDEALRLADRIAIMKNGSIEQCDTPDRIFLNPATQYVAKFTREVQKSKLVKARALVKTSKKIVSSGDPVLASATIKELAHLLMNDGRETIPVVETGGKNQKLIGGMDRKEALEILFGSD